MASRPTRYRKDLLDEDQSTPLNGQVDVFDSSSSKWKPQTVSGLGQTVTSVNGRSGAVTLASSDVGLGNVFNAAQLIQANNLSDLANASIARTNLGLGTAATQNSGAFDSSGSAAAVQSNLSVHIADHTNPHVVTATQVGLGNVANSLQLTVTNNLSDLNNTSTARTNLGLGSAATKNADNSPNNTVLLDNNGLLPTSVLPPLALVSLSVVASQVAMLALTAQPGDVAVRTDLNKTYMLTASPASTLANWQEILTSGSAPVQSVNGFTGTVSLTTTNISEGTNLYFTNARASAAAPVQSVNSLTGTVSLTTTNISEGTNLYFTNARASAAAPVQSVNSLTGAITITADSLLPSQTGNSGKFLKSNGTTTSWASTPSGTVTSVGLSLDPNTSNVWAVSGTPVTTSGNITLSYKNQNAKTALMGPTSGAANNPIFRQPSFDDLAVATADVAVGGFKLTGLADPGSAQDAATLNYVQNQISILAQGLQPKPTATIATATALPAYTYANGTSGVGATITATVAGTWTVDGHVLVANDIVLVKNGAANSDNGLYTVTTAGATGIATILTRHVDMDQSAEFSGAYIVVENGTANANSFWLANPSGTVTVGTTSIPFTQLNGAADLLQGSGISISGNTISVATAGVTNAMLATQVSLAKGGTASDLSATGAAHNVLMQTSSGAAITVSQLGFSDLSGTATAAQIPASIATEEVGVIYDGGGSVITSTSAITYRTVESNATILGYEVLADASGSITVTLKKCTYANFPTTSDITGGANIVLSSAQKSQDNTLSGWTTAINAGDILEFNITGTPATVKRVTVRLKIQRS